jgi:5'-methylthioinosine phosphorylase
VARLAVLGGTGLNDLALASTRLGRRETPFGPASADPLLGRIGATEVVFLARHGQPHDIPPHLINYRANLWLLKDLGVAGIVATNAVGGIAPSMASGDIVVVDQIIDYTWGREHTFSDGDGELRHVDFTAPFDEHLRVGLLAAAAALDLGRGVHPAGAYAATQGPRLESAAEIERLARDGCDVVGMTGMPEAGLARELELPYAALCLIVNKAAGRGDGPISEGEISRVAREGMGAVGRLLACFFERFEIGNQ